MNMQYKVRPFVGLWQKFFLLVTGMTIMLGLLTFFGTALAGPKECPKGQESNCDTYQKVGGKEKFACFPKHANLGKGWKFVKEGCDEKINPAPIPSAEISTPVIIILYTSTPKPIDPPVSTKTPNKPDISVPKFTEAVTPQCSHDCICDIATALSRGNELQEDYNSLYATEVSNQK